MSAEPIVANRIAASVEPMTVPLPPRIETPPMTEAVSITRREPSRSISAPACSDRKSGSSERLSPLEDWQRSRSNGRNYRSNARKNRRNPQISCVVAHLWPVKMALEVGPLAVFFLVNGYRGIFWGTGAFMVATK